MGAEAATLDVSHVDTDTLEALVMGEPVPEPKATTPAPDDDSQQPAAGGDDVARGFSFSPTEVTAPAQPAAPETPAAPAAAAPADEFENLADDERRALEIRKRNPDLSLEAALTLAREQIEAGADPDAQPGSAEPTIDDRLAAINAQLKEAGANEGLYTSEIDALNEERARLLAEKAVQDAVSRVKQEKVTEERTAEMLAEREASYKRAAESCPEALDPDSAIGKSLSAVLEDAERTNNPLLQDPQAPELFLALANARLPEAQRAELKRPAATLQTPSGEPAATEKPQPTPAGVLPVAASARTAQPATATIDPSNVGQAIKDTPTEDLGAALFGAGSGAASVLLRL